MLGTKAENRRMPLWFQIRTPCLHQVPSHGNWKPPRSDWHLWQSAVVHTAVAIGPSSATCNGESSGGGIFWSSSTEDQRVCASSRFPAAKNAWTWRSKSTLATGWSTWWVVWTTPGGGMWGYSPLATKQNNPLPILAKGFQGDNLYYQMNHAHPSLPNSMHEQAFYINWQMMTPLSGLCNVIYFLGRLPKKMPFSQKCTELETFLSNIPPHHLITCIASTVSDGPAKGNHTLMAEIRRLHQLRLVVFPIIYKALAPSQVVSRISSINHQQY